MTTLTLIGTAEADRTAQTPGAATDVPAYVPPGGGLRLTRRGRVALLVLGVLAVVVAFSVGRVSATASPAGPAPTAVVSAGDTLWSVAHRAEPGLDTRAAVAHLAALNGLDEDAPLRAGQVLALPRG